MRKKEARAEDAVRVADKEEKSSCRDCGRSRKQLSQCESSSTRLPQDNKGSNQRNKSRSEREREPIEVQQRDEAKCASRKAGKELKK